MKQGILAVQHLMDDSGDLLDYADFKYNPTCTNKDYHAVIRAIPQAPICTIKRSLYTSAVPRLCVLFVQECLFSTTK